MAGSSDDLGGERKRNVPIARPTLAIGKALKAWTEPKDATMDPTEALKHVRTLVRVASQQDDVDTIHEILAEAEAIVAKAIPKLRQIIIAEEVK